MKENKFNSRLRELRKRVGLTQEELAKRINISLMTFKRWEWGQRAPRLEEIKRIAQALNITEDELLNGPKNEKIKIEVIFDREIWEEASIDMTGNKFSLLFGGDGVIGIKGASGFKSKEDITEFLAKAKKELEDAFDYQVSRGAIPAVN